MAVILQTIYLDAISWMDILILIVISLNYVPKGPVNN